MRVGSHTRRQGFLLLEMILALAVFSMAATGFVVALQRMSRVSTTAQSEMRVTRVLDSAMSETMSLPDLEPGENSHVLEGSNIEIHTLIEVVEGLQTQDGEELTDIVRIRITASWFENGERKQRIAETWRNAQMYRS